MRSNSRILIMTLEKSRRQTSRLVEGIRPFLIRHISSLSARCICTCSYGCSLVATNTWESKALGENRILRNLRRVQASCSCICYHPVKRQRFNRERTHDCLLQTRQCPRKTFSRRPSAWQAPGTTSLTFRPDPSKCNKPLLACTPS